MWNRAMRCGLFSLAGLVLALAGVVTAAGAEPPAAAKQHYEAGLAHKKAKENEAAIQEFREALARYPDYLEAHWALAWTYNAADQTDAAIQEFEAVVRLDPTGEKSQQAREALERLRSRPPDLTPAGKPPELERIAVLPLTNETGDPALDWLEFGGQDALIIGLKSWRRLSDRVVDWDVIMRLLSEVTAEAADQSAFFTGVARESQARWVLTGTFQQEGETLTFHLQWIDGGTGKAIREQTVQGTLVECSRLQIDLEEAAAHLAGDPITDAEREDWAHVNARNPAAWEALINGSLADDLDTVQSQCDAALKADPDYFGVHFKWLGRCSTSVPRALVRQHGQELLRLAPKWPPAYTLVSAAYADSGQLAEAEKLAREGLALAPDAAGLQWVLGHVLLRGNRIEEAESPLRQAVRLAPTWATGHEALGRLLMQRKQWEKARTCFEAAIRLNPFHAEARASLAELWLILGQADASLTTAEDAVRYCPQSTLAHFALAVACLLKMSESKMATASLYYKRCQEAFAQAQELVRYEPQYQAQIDEFAKKMEEVKKKLSWME
jgi:tetratricopeptide (TPR) repeat protein